jgi:cytochrome c oxidase subunit 2
MSLFGIPIFPEQASSFAMDVDALYFFIVAVSAFFSLVVAVLVIIFGIKFRRRRDSEVGARIEGNLPMELMWSVIPTIIAMVMFGWGASVFYHLRRSPDESMHIYAVGKQWMWKFQHPEGRREINELHVPMGRPVKVTVTSEDVLHSLYFPSFRTKIDAIPGRYMELWFEATKAGTYHIFCAEYCGTNHSGMIGSVHVMEPEAYQSWLAGGGEGSLADRGGALFQQLACNTCHLDTGQGRGPSLQNIWGKPVELSDGSTIVVDETYVRESILNSQAKVVRGFQPLMPTFQGLISEEGLVSLIEYVRSLSPTAASAGAPAATPGSGAQGAATPGDEGRAAPSGGRTPQESIERATPGTRKPGLDR